MCSPDYLPTYPRVCAQTIASKERQLSELEMRRSVLEQRVRAGSDKSRELDEAQKDLRKLKATFDKAQAEYKEAVNKMAEQCVVVGWRFVCRMSLPWRRLIVLFTTRHVTQMLRCVPHTTN